jgi:hypothetical protein
MPLASMLENLASRPLMRRAADVFLGRYARRRVAELDRRPAGRVQEQTLLRLVRYGLQTRFGRDHDFASIQTVADYQRRVPLRDYEAFWNEYWRDPFPYLHGVTWPGHVPYFALSSGTTSGTTKYVPVSREMLASNQKAGLTTLAFFLNAYPGTPLFTGRLFFLGGSTDLEELRGDDREWKIENGARLPRGVQALHQLPLSQLHPPASILAGDLSGIAAREVSPILRPYTFPPLELALLRDWERKIDVLARRGAALPITMLSGVPSWLLLLFDRLRQVTGHDHISDVWPMLRLVIHGGTKFDAYRALFRKVIGSDAVRFLETYPASEGFIATEDPRYDLLRLVPDHNVFFEFVPVEELKADRPTRHTAADLETGVQYAVAVTSCAGLWSYLLGDTVCFERHDPPLLRFTGRTRYFLSAFGEHLISEEIERAVAGAAEATGAAVIDFHVGPVFPETPSAPGRHRYLVEFAEGPADLGRFAAELDGALCQLNEDYRVHRAGDLTLRGPEVRPVRRGGFADWMRTRGQLGGQHKVPRMDNSGQVTEQIVRFLSSESR